MFPTWPLITTVLLPTSMVSMFSCCGTILLSAMNMHSSPWLMIKPIWPIARQNEAGRESQWRWRYGEKEGGAETCEPAPEEQDVLLEDRQSYGPRGKR